MMKPLFAGIAIVAAMAAATTGLAQSGSSKQAPAEFPPASFKSSQYVDSRGCVYIRAGIDGNVTWVPRLTRQRKHICGRQPSLTAQATGTAPAPRAETVEQIVIEAPAKPDATAVPAPRVATKAPVKRPQATTVAPVAPRAEATASAPVRAAAVTPKPRAVVVAPKPVVVRQAPKRATTPVKKRRAVAMRKAAPAAPATPVATRVVKPAQPVPSTSLPGSTRVVPRHLEESRRAANQVKVPKGYRPVWTDDRLNPHRAEGTLAGRDKMNLLWTNTVPRRLIDRRTGRDMTAKVALVYPFTSTTQQERELGKVTLITRNGKALKYVQRKPGVASTVELSDRAVPKRAGKKALTSRSAKATVTRKVSRSGSKGESLAGKRYVQVASFGTSRNAQSTAAKLKRMGLPVRIGKLSRGGKTYRLVLAGPFARDTDAKNALKIAQRAGFSDAYLRR